MTAVIQDSRMLPVKFVLEDSKQVNKRLKLILSWITGYCGDRK